MTFSSLEMTTQHPVFWFDDASFVFRVQDHLFKVHKTLLARHSAFFAAIEQPDRDEISTIDPARGVLARDVEVLLGHIYHDTPLHVESALARVVAVLRVSSPLQLDFPSVHTLARERFRAIVPTAPTPDFQPDGLQEALELAVEHGYTSALKPLYYSLMTSSDSDSDANANDAAPSPHAQRCATLMSRVIDHFTPVLFTPPATSHMACTDALADAWMPLVIQPAIDGDGVYRPLETLERMKLIDWRARGLCEACCKDKVDEWTEEQRVVWDRMDAWLELE